ncbi:hypothetical protein [Microbacterium sp. P5_E9]
MDARARFAAGGFFAGAAVVAVLSAVAMANAAAIAEVPGASTGLPAIRVAASVPSVASPLATVAANPPASIVLPVPVPTTETVPAPEPAVLSAVTSAGAAAGPAAHPADITKHDKVNKTSADKSAAQTPAKAGNPSGHQLNEQSGLKRSRSHVPPDGD